MTGCFIYLALSAFAGFAAYGWALGKNLPEPQAQAVGIFAFVAALVAMGLIYKCITTPSTQPSGTPPPRMTWNPSTNRREPVQEPIYYPEPEYHSESGGMATRNRGTITARQGYQWNRHTANIGPDEYDRLREAERRILLVPDTYHGLEDAVQRQRDWETPQRQREWQAPEQRQSNAQWVESKYPNGHGRPPTVPTCPGCGSGPGDCTCIEIGDFHTKSAFELQAEENRRWAEHYREASRRADKHHPEDSSGYIHTIGGKVVDD